jgi:hypothetical protein
VAQVPPLSSSTINSAPYSPGATPLVLGAVTFRSIEAPAEMPIGTVSQMTARKVLPGGTVVEQTFGPDLETVTWRGQFRDVDVDSRVRMLQQYAADGQERLITWGSQRYYCVVKKFIPTWHHEYKCEYEITIEITQDGTGLAQASSAPLPDSQIGALTSSAATTAAQLAAIDASASSVQQQVANVQQTVQQTGPIGQAGPSAAQQVLQTVQQAISAATAYATEVSGSSKNYVLISQILSALNLIVSNVQRAQSAQTVTVQGGNLFAIAAKYFGDPSLALSLAQINGLPSLFLPNTQPTTLTLPPTL